MLKGLVFYLLFFFLSPFFLWADSFVLGNQTWLLIPKTVGFVQTLSGELQYKVGFSLYIDINSDSSLDTSIKRKVYEEEISSRLPIPHGILFFFYPSKKIDIILDKSSKHLFDTDKVFFEYIAPLLPEKDEDLTPQRISGFLLNGYSEIADRVADKYGVKLENNFPSSNVNSFIRIILYIMLFILVGLFALVYFFKKKRIS